MYIYIAGCVWLLLVLCVTAVKSQDDAKSVGTHEECEHDADGDWEASGKKSYLIDEKQNAEGKEEASEAIPTEEACFMDDCSLMQDDDDQSELSMLTDQDGEFNSEEEKVSSQDFCEMNSKCSKEAMPEEPADGDAIEEALGEEIPIVVEADMKEDGEAVNVNEEGPTSFESGENEDESELNKVDPEMENIPLREILLKLKVGWKEM